MMKTTILFVELVVVGTGAALALALLFYTHFGVPLCFSQIQNNSLLSNEIIFIIPALSFVYVIGIVIDKIAYQIFKYAVEDSFREQCFVTTEHYYRARHNLYTCGDAKEAIEAFEYGRSKVRICRGWTINSIFLILALILFMNVHGFDHLILVVIVFLVFFGARHYFFMVDCNKSRIQMLKAFQPNSKDVTTSSEPTEEEKS